MTNRLKIESAENLHDPALVTLSKPGVAVETASPDQCVLFKVPLGEFFEFIDAVISPSRTNRPLKERVALLEANALRQDSTAAALFRFMHDKFSEVVDEAVERTVASQARRKWFRNI